MMKEKQSQFVAKRWIVVGAVCLLMPSAKAFEREPATPMVVPAKVPNGSVHVELSDGSSILGKMDLDRRYRLKMSVGEAEIPARKIISFEFANSRFVRIRSIGGDIYSGELDLDSLSFEFAWGKTEIPTKHIKLVVSQSHAAKVRRTLRPVIEIGPNGRVTTSFTDETTSNSFEEIADDLRSARSGSVN